MKIPPFRGGRALTPRVTLPIDGLLTVALEEAHEKLMRSRNLSRIGTGQEVERPRTNPRQTLAVWTVTEVSPGKGFAWQTKRIGMIMTGSHRLAEAGGKCHNTLVIDIAGPGARLFGLLLGGAFGKSRALENAGFKERAEKPE